MGRTSLSFSLNRLALAGYHVQCLFRFIVQTGNQNGFSPRKHAETDFSLHVGIDAELRPHVDNFLIGAGLNSKTVLGLLDIHKDTSIRSLITNRIEKAKLGRGFHYEMDTIIGTDFD